VSGPQAAANEGANGVKRIPVGPVLTLATLALVLLAASGGRGEEWVIYEGSGARGESGTALRDWYVLNRLTPLPRSGAAAHHYYDLDSVASNSPFPGGIVRVWEKFVFQKETLTYDEAREAIRKETEARLKRKLTALDYGWLFPAAVNRATREITTLYEINCDSLEFYILEVSAYDKAGKRMTRDVNMDRDLWIPVQPGTVLEALSRIVCQQ